MRREARTIAATLARQGSTEEAQSAIYFMVEDWVEYHVRDSDRQLAAYLREHAGNGAVALPGIRPLKAAGKISADFDEQILVRGAGSHRAKVGQGVAEPDRVVQVGDGRGAALPAIHVDPAELSPGEFASWVRKASICSFCVRATSPCWASKVC